MRSGKYSQVIGVLNARGGYCCLGVACEMALEDGVPVVKESRYPAPTLYDRCSAFLPQSVSDWLGLYDWNPLYGVLTRMNDSGKTFAEIADIIEKGLIENNEQ